MSIEHLEVEGRAVTICRGPDMEEVRRDSEGEKWCFRCRRRREFFYVVMAPVGISYYGPHAEIRCEHCNGNGTDLFPGWTREWED